MRASGRPGLPLLLLVLCSLSAATSLRAAESYYYDAKLGGSGAGTYQFSNPEGVCVHGSELFVADRSNHRVRVFTLDGVFQRGYAGGASFSPADVAVDSSGNVYVTDANQGQIVKLNSALTEVLGTWSSDGDDEDQLYGPQGICLDESRDRVYVADTNHQRISVWHRNGTFVRVFGTYGDGDGELTLPTDVAIDSLGRIYVTDSGNDRVQRFGPNCTYQAQFAGSLSGGGVMRDPHGILIDSNDRVYVSSKDTNKVYKYTIPGACLCGFGSGGTANGQLDQPWGLAMDSSGRLYVVDSGNDRVQRFKSNRVPTQPTTLTIRPALPRDDSTLRATASGSTDADGDGITYSYRWYSSPNNTTWTLQGAGRTVAPADTTVGQYWRVRARAYDGHAYSTWKTSTSVQIGVASVARLSAAAQQAGPGTLAVTVTLGASAQLSGEVCNLAGRPVAAIAPRVLEAGTSAVLLPARAAAGTRLPAGTYLLKLRAKAPDGTLSSAVCAVSLR